MLRSAAQASAFALLLAAAGRADAPPEGAPAATTMPRWSHYAEVTVDPTRTSIYVGSVSLTMPPFARHEGVFTAGYTARVFPLFFYNERGRIWIEFSDDNLRQLHQGEVVYFKGHAANAEGKERRVEGRAVPESAGSDRGRIKVRVWVGRVELIFNTLYRFTGPG